MKKFKTIFCTIVMITIFSGYAKTASLELLKTIGDDRDNYLLIGANDALFTENNDIYILNAKGNFISHYDWDGNFIRRIGRQGNGPGDLSYPSCISYFKEKLYVLENGNRRITVFDTKTNEFNYYRENESARFDTQLHVINENRLMGVFQYIDDKHGRIGIVDKNFNLIGSFFNDYPVEFNKKLSPPSATMSIETAARKVITSSFFKPTYFFDDKTGEVLVSFKYPDNPVTFFIYTIDGKLLKKFAHTLKDKKYKFPTYLLTLPVEKLRYPDNWPARSEIFVDSVFIYSDYYVAFLNLRDYIKKEVIDNQRHCFIFDKEGNLKFNFKVEKDLMIFRLSNGFFLGKVLDAEVEKIYIYKLKLN